jgi:hypothetical protein
LKGAAGEYGGRWSDCPRTFGSDQLWKQHSLMNGWLRVFDLADEVFDSELTQDREILTNGRERRDEVR